MEIKILIIDDEDIICDGLSRILKKEGYLVDCVTKHESALNIVKEKTFEIILLDINMPGKSGIELLPEIKDISPESQIIMITAYDVIEMAIKCIKEGADDYFVKSSNYEDLLIKINKALKLLNLQKEATKFHSVTLRGLNIDKFIGNVPKIKEVYRNIRKISQTYDTTVLITGASGTGKEVVAKYIHYLSDRNKNPFIVENCAGISSGLCESEFFGCEKGAYTDAKKDRKGVFELADGGTLFLDEMGSMNFNLQGVLLRVIEEKKFRRLGGTKDIEIDVRIISATNQDLRALIKEGKFREDLFHRLSAFHIELPILRDRRDDIIDLAYYFIKMFNPLLGKHVVEIEPNAKELLYDYNFPGNIRELKNLIERVMILGNGTKITYSQLARHIKSENNKTCLQDDNNMSLQQMESKHILNQLKCCKGNKTETARRLGISRSTLNLKLKQY